MRFPVPLVIEIPDDQLTAWAFRVGTPHASDGRVRAKDAVDGVRAQVLQVLRTDFTRLGVDADVSVKR